MKRLFFLLLLFSIHFAFSQYIDYTDQISASADKIEPKEIQWRQDFHQNPELGNRETRTAGIVAKHLKSLGMEVKTGVVVTGPDFMIDDSAFKTGVNALCNLVLDYMEMNKK